MKKKVMIKVFGSVGGGKTTILNEIISLFDARQRESGFPHMVYNRVVQPNIRNSEEFPIESEDGVIIEWFDEPLPRRIHKEK